MNDSDTHTTDQEETDGPAEETGKPHQDEGRDRNARSRNEGEDGDRDGSESGHEDESRHDGDHSGDREQEKPLWERPERMVSSTASDARDGRSFPPALDRVGDRDLFIGNFESAQSEYQDRSFEWVISLTHDPQDRTDHHHPLNDGRGNDLETFEAAVEAAKRAIEADGDVLIHCAAGISRSAAVIATALASLERRKFNDVVDEIHRHRSEIAPNPALRYLARQCLGEQPSDYEQRYATER